MSSVGSPAYEDAGSRGRLGWTPTLDPLVTGDPIRILIVEDLRAVADALEAVLNRQPGMVVVGNVDSMINSTSRVKADIVILEFRQTDEFAADALRTIFQPGSTAKVIFLTSDEGDQVILAAIDAGASAVLYLSSATVDVIQTIRAVADGVSLISPRTIAALLSGRRKSEALRDSLTRREMEVLSLMSGGASNRNIASRLGISYVTVRCHVRSLSVKLAAHSKLEVLVRAQQLELVDLSATPRSSYA
ncbi:MAG TPA: response regulator transcription factor [Candidatus Acidoferrum sp.]|nr:response regulator transcription factor [Candidatus Acidoferrum sp.]